MVDAETKREKERRERKQREKEREQNTCSFSGISLTTPTIITATVRNHDGKKWTTCVLAISSLSSLPQVILSHSRCVSTDRTRRVSVLDEAQWACGGEGVLRELCLWSGDTKRSPSRAVITRRTWIPWLAPRQWRCIAPCCGGPPCSLGRLSALRYGKPPTPRTCPRKRLLLVAFSPSLAPFLASRHGLPLVGLSRTSLSLRSCSPVLLLLFSCSSYCSCSCFSSCFPIAPAPPCAVCVA